MSTLMQLSLDNYVSVDEDGGGHLTVDPLGEFQPIPDVGVIKAPTAPPIVASILTPHLVKWLFLCSTSALASSSCRAMKGLLDIYIIIDANAEEHCSTIASMSM
ncbi:hypothetical protein BHM03_00009634 [Ensete ventricosum]|nr:hypothetical protein BHM03_00009634 [Ensete ventricosum]